MSPPPSEKLAPLEEGEGIEDVDDPERLLALAKAYRAGSDGMPRDMKKCCECYVAAADLGSAEAAYAAALFFMSGTVVPQDFKEGAARLRAAADGGVLAAKVYVANLYELGVHYKADAEKADVWYRNAARTARIESAPDTPDFARAMAALGCVRWALELQGDEDLPKEEREAYLKKASTLGYQLKLKAERLSAPAPAPALASAPEPAPASAPAPAPAPAKKPVKKSSGRARAGVVAFLYAIVFFALGVGAGIAAHHGAAHLLATRGAIPVFGHRLDLVFPSVLGLLGVLPTLLAYKFVAFVRALVVGAATGLVGFGLWGAKTLVLFESRAMQATVGALAGFALVLLLMGFLGGAKSPAR